MSALLLLLEEAPSKSLSSKLRFVGVGINSNSPNNLGDSSSILGVDYSGLLIRSKSYFERYSDSSMGSLVVT